MAIWLCRAGRIGEFETKFLEDNRIYCTWNNLNVNLQNIKDKSALQDYFVQQDEDVKVKTAMNWASQVWPFAHEMKIGEWVMLPSKTKPSVYIGKIQSYYEFVKDAVNPYYHFHKVEWFAEIPRENFDKDILFSIGAFMTICRIKQEDRIKAIVIGIKVKPKSTLPEGTMPVDLECRDIEADAIDEISNLIIRKFKGHDLAKLVDSILRAKGYTTYLSPEGPDLGVDILAAKGALGFDNPKICVQVKSQDSPVDRPTLDQLIGAISNFKADYGLLVSWSGFKSSVTNVVSNHFFKVRFWTHKEILKELLENYENLDNDIKSEIPLKRIWVINNIDE